MGMIESVRTNGFRGDMLSTAVGRRLPVGLHVNASRLARSSAVPFTRRAGVLMIRRRGSLASLDATRER